MDPWCGRLQSSHISPLDGKVTGLAARCDQVEPLVPLKLELESMVPSRAIAIARHSVMVPPLPPLTVKVTVLLPELSAGSPSSKKSRPQAGDPALPTEPLLKAMFMHLAEFPSVNPPSIAGTLRAPALPTRATPSSAGTTPSTTSLLIMAAPLLVLWYALHHWHVTSSRGR